MKAWRRAHPNATAEQIELKGAHVEALKALSHAESQEGLGKMPSRMVESIRRREAEARAAWNDIDPDAGRSSQKQKHSAEAQEAQALGATTEKCIISWTGGKDCNLALLTAWRDPTLNVVALVVFKPEDAEFKAHPLFLMEAQAASIGLPLLHVIIERDAPSYKEAYVRGMVKLREERNITVIVTGDMDLVGSMTRNWIEECGEDAGLRTILPLWQSDREANLRKLHDERYRIVFSCVKSPWFDASWIGRCLDEAAIVEMKAMVASPPKDAKPLDLGGEGGEYHTMCVDGPLYAHPVTIAIQPARELINQPGQKEGERWWTIGITMHEEEDNAARATDWLNQHAEEHGHSDAAADLNQYWYSQSTITTLVKVASEAKPDTPTAKLRIAFVSTPSLFFALDPNARKDCRVLDYDRDLGTNCDEFVFYDFHEPNAIPSDLLHAFSIVVIDPPYIEHDVWRQYAVTAKLLLADGGYSVCTTVIENASLLEELLGVTPNTYLPSIPHLPYQYAVFTNFKHEALDQRNEEVSHDPAEFLAAPRQSASEAREKAAEKPIQGAGASYDFEAMIEAELRRQQEIS